MPSSLSTTEILTRLASPASREALLNSWPFTRCSLCHSRAATGIWMCKFSTQSPPYFRAELRPLCPACGFTDGYAKWNGFMAPKLLRVDLFLTITTPSLPQQTKADFLIDRLLSHPQGEAYFQAWRGMYKPANLHHPIHPAQLMLEALVEKLFPPQTNKVD